MKKFLTLLLVFLLAATAQSQTTVHSITHDGLSRSYRVHLPVNYTLSAPTPLVLNMHGYTSNAAQQEIYSMMNAVADTSHFIVVYPEGVSNAWNSWYYTGPDAIDDVGFLNALVDTLAADYPVDLNRVYCTGMSNGGFMSYVMACESSDRIAAIASVTGTMVVTAPPQCETARPVPVMQIHGTADPTVPYDGTAEFMPIEDVIALWVQKNGCTDMPDFQSLPDIDTTDGCTASTLHYISCDGGSEVLFYKIEGGAHTWPDALIDIGVTNHDFNASAEIWKFFERFTLQGPVSAVATPQPVTIRAGWQNDELFLDMPDNDFNKLEIFDMQGHSLGSYPLSGRIHPQISMPGVFILRFSNARTVQVIKTVKRD